MRDETTSRTAEILLRCDLTDPVDGTCRILMLLARCGIGLRGMDLAAVDDGNFRAQLCLAGPLPFSLAHLQDRLQAIPGIVRTGNAA